jgi:hypothetical protein
VNRKLYSANVPQLVNNINGYLIAAPNIFIESRKHPLSNIPEMIKGSSPVDGGNLTVTNQDYMKIIQKDAIAKKYIKPFLGAKEYLHNTKRWCVWLVGAEPVDINKSVFIMNRIAAVREFRLKSKKATTNKYANYATRFMEIRQPMTNYILVPRHSSENRKYIPFGFMNKETICGDANNMIPNATLYHFGVLESNVHMAWVKTICGRIKSDYRYSNDIVYNNFPWPESTETQIQKIEQTAQGILDARALYPDSSLADLYNPVTMPMELMNAHRANDKAVWEAYGKAWDITSESGCVAYLMKLYQELVAKN